MTRSHRVLITFLLPPAAACSGDGRPGSESFQIDTLPSGLVQVVNDGAGVWTPETEWNLREDLRLGTVDGGGPEQFSQVSWVREGQDGRIFVLDYRDQDIRVFSAGGQYSHTIGRKGHGPGEFQSAAGLNWDPEGLLLALLGI